MKRIRQEISAGVKTMKEATCETKFFKHEDAALTVFQGKQSKNVLVLNTVIVR